MRPPSKRAAALAARNEMVDRILRRLATWGDLEWAAGVVDRKTFWAGLGKAEKPYALGMLQSAAARRVKAGHLTLAPDGLTVLLDGLPKETR